MRPQAEPVAPKPAGRRSAQRAEAAETNWVDLLLHPRNLVFAVLILAVGFGGGHKLLAGWRARRAANRLAEDDVTPAEIEAAAEHGRAVLPELMTLLAPSQPMPRREAAARALSALWAQDQLVAEEEQSIVRVGHEIVLSSRRVYPRALRSPIRLNARVRILAASEDNPPTCISPDKMLIATRIIGTRTIAYENYTDQPAGDARAEYLLDPALFQGPGPHRLEFQARVKSAGLPSDWELELPPRVITLEFDERLEPEAILATPDVSRAELWNRVVAIRLAEAIAPSHESPSLSLNPSHAIPGSLELAATHPLPCDLAHQIHLEIEGVPGRLRLQDVVWLDHESKPPVRLAHHPTQSAASLPIEHPGDYRARLILTPDCDLAWSHAGVRSVWPEIIHTPWMDVAVWRLG